MTEEHSYDGDLSSVAASATHRIARAERLQRILELLAEQRTVRVDVLCKLFKVSGTVIRRDLRELQSQGLLQRIRGGAIGSPSVVDRFTFQQRAKAHLAEKMRIGKLAATLIQDDTTVFMDSGTTTLQVARNIGHVRNLTLVTESLAIMNEIGPRNGINVVLVGGSYSQSSLATTGPLAVANLRRFHGQQLFLGVDGISLTYGLTGNEALAVEVLRAMIGRVEEVILVADSSKIGRVAFLQIAPLHAADKLVTDSGMNPEDLAAFKAAGLEVLVA